VRKPEPAISRVLSSTTIHLGQPSPAASSNLPGSPFGTDGGRHPDSPIGGVVRRPTPLFGLAPGGVYRAASCYQSRGALLPHHFTLTDQRSAVYFLWHFPWAHAPQALPGALSEGARTFLCEMTRSDCLADSGSLAAHFTGSSRVASDQSQPVIVGSASILSTSASNTGRDAPIPRLRQRGANCLISLTVAFS